jgi:sporulation protein YunB
MAWRFERTVEPALMGIAEAKASVLATDIINRVINECVVRETKSAELLSIEKNQAGDVVLIKVNTMEIGRLETMAVAAVQSEIKAISEEEIRIPLGQVLGSRVFAAWGPAIRVRVVPMARAGAEITDRFESAGINQVKHCVYLNADVQLRVMLPLASSFVSVKSSVPLTTVILPGKVPVTYVDIR